MLATARVEINKLTGFGATQHYTTSLCLPPVNLSPKQRYLIGVFRSEMCTALITSRWCQVEHFILRWEVAARNTWPMLIRSNLEGMSSG